MQERYKFPKIWHVPFSPGNTKGDRKLADLNNFLYKRVIVTEKIDGENTNIYPDGIHARSIDSKDHVSRAWVKAFAATFQHNIPAGWRVCGENVYAKHSIHYTNLKTYFYGFCIFDHENKCLSWEDTLSWFEEFKIIPVPVIAEFIFEPKAYDTLVSLGKSLKESGKEGFVMRVAESFPFSSFKNNYAKYVRSGHVTTADNWLSQPVVKNIIGESK